MDKVYGLLEKYNANNITHSQATLMHHLEGTHALLQQWSCPEPVCTAGLCHSIYGTQAFTNKTVPLDAREEVRAVIGEHAEKLVYLFCVMDMPSFRRHYDHYSEVQSFAIHDRHEERELTISRAEFIDLVSMDIANTLEQLPRFNFFIRFRYNRHFKKVFTKVLPLVSQPVNDAVRRYFKIVPRHSP